MVGSQQINTTNYGVCSRKIINKQGNLNNNRILKIINNKMLNMEISINKKVILNKILHKIKIRMKMIIGNSNPSSKY